LEIIEESYDSSEIIEESGQGEYQGCTNQPVEVIATPIRRSFQSSAV